MFGALCVAFVACSASMAADSPRKIVLIGGAKSEGSGRHDYPNAIRVLDRLLRSSPRSFRGSTSSASDGWPRDSALDAPAPWSGTSMVSTTIRCSHPNAARDSEAAMRAGVGLVVLHQASTVPATDRTLDLQRWLGGARYGMFDRATEMAQIAPATPAHPVSRGLAPFTYLDEFYPTIRWAATACKPILKARLHVESREGKDLVIGEPVTSTVAWVYERADGGGVRLYRRTLSRCARPALPYARCS